MQRKTTLGGWFAASVVLAILVVGGPLRAMAAPPANVEPKIEKNLAWYDVEQWGVEGKGWAETQRYYDRLPAKAEGKVRPPVWNLSRDSSGMSVLFSTDAPEIWVRYRLRSHSLSMPHMPATGCSGMDLYARDDKGQWRWVAVNKPTSADITARLAGNLRKGTREYRIYLPLFNSPESLEIGVPSGAKFVPIAPRAAKPVVIYGTSICHGGCASRPGMAWVNIVGRKLDRPIINLGFSGNGTMDASVGELLGELEPAVYVIDCLPNMGARQVSERTIPLVQQIRKARPEVPIVLVEDRFYTDGWLNVPRQVRNETNHAALKKAYEQLRADGVKGLYYVPGKDLLGDDNEAAVDGSHPTDLGMMRQADAITAVVKKALAEQ